MSIQTELTRVANARNSIRNKMSELGVALPTDNITELATKINGIVDRGAVHAEVAGGQTFTIPQGFHNGSGTVTGTGGDPEDFRLQAKVVTPTKSQQNITPDTGYFGLSAVTVHPIPSQYQDVSSVTADAEDVLATKTFVPASGVLTAGTMPNNGAVTGTINGLTVTEYTIPRGFHNGAGKVSLTNDIENALRDI